MTTELTKVELQGQVSRARPRKRSYMKSAAQQGASGEHQND